MCMAVMDTNTTNIQRNQIGFHGDGCYGSVYGCYEVFTVVMEVFTVVMEVFTVVMEVFTVTY